MHILGSAETFCVFYERQHLLILALKIVLFIWNLISLYYCLNFIVMLGPSLNTSAVFNRCNTCPLISICARQLHSNSKRILWVIYSLKEPRTQCAVTVCLVCFICFIRSFVSSKIVWSLQANWTNICVFFRRCLNKYINIKT